MCSTIIYKYFNSLKILNLCFNQRFGVFWYMFDGLAEL